MITVHKLIEFLKQFKEDDEFAILVQHEPTQNSIEEQVDKDAYFTEPTLDSLTDRNGKSIAFVRVEI